MKKTKKKYKISDWIVKNKFYLLAFALPVVSMLIVFAFKGCAPFGDEMYLRSDCYHQYTPYLEILQQKLRSGGSLLYTWNIGGGMNFVAITAYYLASPLNLLTLIWPTNMADITDFFIVLKMGLAGFGMTYYLTKRFKKEGALPVAFGMAYALSAYFAAFSWNIMWLDCMWLLPFIILGLDRLVRERKCLMYCIALGLGIFSNYYIGIMLCIFSVLYFIYLIITSDIDTTAGKIKARLLIIKDYAIYSLIGGCLAAVVIIPEYMNLLTTKSADTTFPTSVTEYFSVVYMLFRSLITIPVADLKYYHDPNIYCSVAIFILIPLFWLCKKIPLKRRIGKTVLMAIMLLSFNLNIPDYIWHGFHFPNSLPCRESFLYIFLILTMGYEAMLYIKDYKLKHIIGAAGGAIGLLLIFEQLFDTTKLEIFTDVSISITMVRVIFVSITFIAIYALLMLLYKHFPQMKGFFAYLMILILFCELTLNMNITGVQSTSSRTGYYAKTATLKALNEVGKKDAKNDNVVFYRTESKDHDTRNDGARFNYNSISTFSSVASAAIQDYYDQIGLQTSFNACSYYGHTPLTAALFSIRYEYATQEPSLTNYMTKLDKNGYGVEGVNGYDEDIYKYNQTLPLGFVINSSTMSKWDMSTGNPFTTQNNFVKSAIPNGVNVFHKLKDLGSPGNFEATYALENDDTFAGDTATNLDVYFFATTDAESLSVEVTGATSKTLSFTSTNQHYICHVGDIAKGSTVKVSAGDGKAISACYAYAFDPDAWTTSYEALKESPLEVSEWKDTKIVGKVNAQKTGLLYTSIPYENGWSVYVDGKKVKPTKICNKALLGVMVSQGEHEIVFKYIPAGFIPGIIITILAILALVVIFKYQDFMLWYDNRKKKNSLKALKK